MLEKYLCNTCLHKEVCKFKDQYKKAQDATQNIMVSFEDNSMIELRYINWIEPIRLSCRHYYVDCGHSYTDRIASI